MTQSEFMYDLMLELDGVPDEEKYVLMNDYTCFFDNCAQSGLSEDKALGKLRSPKEIAESYKKGKPVPIEGVDSVLVSDQNGQKTFLSVLKFILMIPVCFLYEIAAVALGTVLFAAAAALCISAALICVGAFMSVTLDAGFVVFGLGSILLTFSFIMLAVLVFKSLTRAVKFFPNLMGGILRNKKGEQRF